MKFKNQYINFWRYLLILVFLQVSVSGMAQVRIGHNLSIQSKILDQKIHYSVILPSSYHIDKKDYPVIYLLHGYGGNHESWLSRCHIDQIVDSLLQLNAIGEFIYVMPDAKNSYYINNFDSTFMYQDFFIQELVPAIDSLFRTKKQKEFRTLMGLSMGGFGSIILAVKNPELFGTVVALSPAVRNEDIYKDLSQEKYKTLYGPVYGPGLENENRVTQIWKENSPYFLIDSLSVKNYYSINWYIDCGIYDSLLPASEAFHQLLLQYKIPHELHERPGEHNWAYWHHSTVQGLEYITNKTHLFENK